MLQSHNQVVPGSSPGGTTTVPERAFFLVRKLNFIFFLSFFSKNID